MALGLACRRERDGADALTPSGATNISSGKLNALPVVVFRDITREAGIGFVHTNGAFGAKWLPETMGGGVAFLDYDSDGKPDLLLINSGYWPGKSPPAEHPPLATLYHNDGNGHFTDVTASSGLDAPLYGMGVAVGDFDNDGLEDLAITGVGGACLFRNLGGGRFQDVTTTAGVGGSPQDWSTSAAWLDIDNDGLLDLFVCNYVQWSPELDEAANYQLPGIGRAYGPPMAFGGTYSRLYHNLGNGRFADISEKSGIQIRDREQRRALGKSLALAPVDIDNDGFIDLVVANDTVQNFVFRNQRDGTFREIGAESAIAFDVNGQARGAMGIDSARFRNDDTLGIAIGNFANQMNSLYVAQGDPLVFADEAIHRGFGPASRSLLKFGLYFFDYDLDGRLDVLTVNGHLDEQIGRASPGQSYRQPAQLFWNSGPGGSSQFVPVPDSHAGPDIFRPIVGRGSAFADIDGDGDLDVVMTQINGPPVLLRNDQALARHWLRVKLVGKRSNRDAIGAWVKVRVGGQTLSRQVMPTRSYLSQSELPLTFGLGANQKIEGMEILWPGGRPQRLGGMDVDRVVTVEQE